jgi:hypothetical protein
MFFTDLKVRLNKQLRDADNATFTDAEKTEALTDAIEESIVAVVELDSSKTFINGTRSYGLGANIKQVYNVSLDTGYNGNPTPLPGEVWDFLAPNLTFNQGLTGGTPTSMPLYIEWLRKLLVSDDIPAPFDKYVINQAVYNTTQILANGKVNRFLKNDVSLGDIITRGQVAQREANRLKKQLPAQRFVGF